MSSNVTEMVRMVGGEPWKCEYAQWDDVTGDVAYKLSGRGTAHADDARIIDYATELYDIARELLAQHGCAGFVLKPDGIHMCDVCGRAAELLKAAAPRYGGEQPGGKLTYYKDTETDNE